MSEQSFWGRLLQRSHRRVYVKAHGRPGVTEAARKLYRDDSLLMPKGGAAVPKQVRVETFGATHGVAESGALDSAEGLHEGDEPRLDRDPAALIRLGDLRAHTDPLPDHIHISLLHRYRFADSHPSLFYEDDCEPITHVQWDEEGEDLICIRGLWYSSWRLGEPNGDVAGWILRERIEDLPDFAHIACDCPRPQPVLDHLADPADHVGGGE